MEIQGDHKIQTKTKITNGLQNSPDELNLFDDQQKAQDKTEDRADHKEPNEVDRQDSNTVTTNDDELTSNNEIFADVLTKIRAFVYELKQEKLEKNILIHEWQIFNDFFNLIEKHDKNFTDEDLLVIKRGLELFLQATYNINPSLVFTTDLDYAKEIFYMYFNLINIANIKNYLTNAQMPDDLKILYRVSISRILTVMRQTSALTDLGLNDPQRPTNCIELLSLILNYVRRDLESSDLATRPSPTDASSTREFILTFILCYADKTVLIRDLIEVGCPEIMINGLKIMCNKSDVHIVTQRQIISIIHNISRHDDGVKELNALNATEVIKLFQSNHENIEVNITCYMTLALLSTPEQIKHDCQCVNSVLDTLVRMVYESSISSDHRTKDAIHLSELIIVFVKLFNDDHALNYIMEHLQVDVDTSSTTEFFINQLIYYYYEISNDDPLKHTTCTALVNILWSVSFQEKYKQQLKNASKKFKELILNLTKETNEKIPSNQYVPDYIENIKKAAEGLLFNIDELIDPIIEKVGSASTVLENNQKPMIMISYSHQNIDFCKQLYNEMHKRGYDIWIDFKFLKTGDLWEQIAVGMKRASVIICLLSEDYYKSKSCRWEATYALDKLQATKSVIPVFLCQHEVPEWLEIRTAVLKYVRFLNLKQLEDDKVFELIDMIEHSLSPTISKTDLNLHPPVLPTHHEPASIPMTKVNKPTQQSNILPVHHDEPPQAKPIVTKLENQNISSTNSSVISTESLYPEKPIKEWNKNDISQWFQHNNILIELRDLCQFADGYELLNYAKIFLDTEKLQYQMYSDEFLRRDGITSGQRPLLLHEFTKFSNALRKLEKFNKSS